MDITGPDQELTFKSQGLELWCSENPIKFQEACEALSPDYQWTDQLPDEFDAIFIHTNYNEAQFWYKGVTITTSDNSCIEKTKNLKYGDVVTMRIR